MKISLPPLPIQKKIAEVLDRADELRQIKKKTIEKLDQLIQSIFLDMFGDPVTNPKGWEVKKLGDVCSKITDGTHQPPPFVSSGIPFLFVSNNINNEIDYNAKKFISETTYNELTKNSPIEIDDILITSVGSYGNPAIVKSSRKFCFQRHIAHIKPIHEMVNSSFLFSLLKTDYVNFQIDRRVKGIAQKTLNLSEFRPHKLI